MFLMIFPGNFYSFPDLTPARGLGVGDLNYVDRKFCGRLVSLEILRENQTCTKPRVPFCVA